MGKWLHSLEWSDFQGQPQRSPTLTTCKAGLDFHHDYTFACICADFVSWLKVINHVLKSSYTWTDSLQGHSKVAFNSWNSLWTWIPGCIGSTTPKTNFQDWVLRISGELQPAKPRFIAYTLSSRLISWMLFTFASYLSWPEAFCSGNAWMGFLATVKTLYWYLELTSAGNYRLDESVEAWDSVKSLIFLLFVAFLVWEFPV